MKNFQEETATGQAPVTECDGEMILDSRKVCVLPYPFIRKPGAPGFVCDLHMVYKLTMIEREKRLCVIPENVYWRNGDQACLPQAVIGAISFHEDGWTREDAGQWRDLIHELLPVDRHLVYVSDQTNTVYLLTEFPLLMDPSTAPHTVEAIHRHMEHMMPAMYSYLEKHVEHFDARNGRMEIALLDLVPLSHDPEAKYHD